MDNARSKLDRGGRAPADGSTDEGAQRDLAELARKRAAAADIARRLAALKQVRAHPGGAPIRESSADKMAPEEASRGAAPPAPEVTASPAAGRSADWQSPGAPAMQPRRGSDHPDPAARPHPLVQARAISDAARRQKAGQDFAPQNFAGQNFANRALDERAAREWAYDQPPQRRTVSVEPALPAEDAARPALYGTAFSALLTGAVARPRLDIERPAPQPAADHVPVAPQPVEVAPQVAETPVVEIPVAETASTGQAMSEPVPVADSAEAVADWTPAAHPEPDAVDAAADDHATRVRTDDAGPAPIDAQEVAAQEVVTQETDAAADAADDDASDTSYSQAVLEQEIAAVATRPTMEDAGPAPIDAQEIAAQEADAQATDPADDTADDDDSDAPYGHAPLEHEIAAAAARVAQAAGDVTDDREPSLWTGRAPILVANPAPEVGDRFAEAARDAAIAESAVPEQPEATPSFHIAELTQAPTRRRAHRAARLVGLAAIVGTAAGAAAILQSPLREQSDPVAVVSAAVGGSAMGRVAEMSAPDPQAAPAPAPLATVSPPPAPDIANAPGIANAPQAATQSMAQPAPGMAAPPPTIEPAPQAAAPAPAPGAAPSAAPQIAATPADAPPTEEAAPEAPQTPRALAKMLRAPVPEIPGATEIGAAPVTMPQMPAEPSAGQAAGATLATPPEAGPAAGGTPRVAAKLKPDPAQSHVLIEGAAENAAAKPFVPQAAANPAQPAAKPAAQPAKPAKAAKSPPEPIKGVLDLLAPFMNGSKPQETQWGKRK